MLLVNLISKGTVFHNLTILLEKQNALMLVFLYLTNILPSAILVKFTCGKEKMIQLATYPSHSLFYIPVLDLP